jgi:hypothetical protein
MSVAFMLMVALSCAVRVRLWNSHRQRTRQISGNSLIRIGFRRHQSRDAFNSQPLAQSLTHAASNQYLHIIQRMWFVG